MKAWKRANFAMCTTVMLKVLQQLRDANETDNPYLYLENIHGNTLKALVERDWILTTAVPKSKIPPSYKITARGIKACKIYEIPPEQYDKRRFDGICSRCNKNKRGIFSTGTIKPYCDPCMKIMQNRKYQLFGYQKKEGLCTSCNKRNKHVMASGQVRSYCLPCRRQKSKAYRKRRNQRNLAKVQQGKTLLCYRCHQKPRHVTANTVQDYCQECLREYTSNRRRL